MGYEMRIELGIIGFFAEVQPLEDHQISQTLIIIFSFSLLNYTETCLPLCTFTQSE